MFHRYNLVIVASSFFNGQVYGTPLSMPVLPLKEIEGVPLLFGEAKTVRHGDTLAVYADIIASAYFLLTRYEEIRRRDVRDEHGRFPGKESLPYRAGFIHRPVVDEYGKLLRGWLRETGVSITEPAPRIRKIWLTHDADAPFYCRSLRNALRETVKGKGIGNALRLLKQPLEKDPYYTFPWLIEQDNKVIGLLGKKRSNALYFLKAGGKSAQDKPRYSLRTPDGASLLGLLQSRQAIVGLHSSYDAGRNPLLIGKERELLMKISKQKIRHNRHHYLAAREPEDLVLLERAGIAHDFTMGYPDVAGFRLGTSRPVRWINPANKHVSSLILHPLTMMDVTLSETKYMNLSYEEAFDYCLRLINQAEQAGGEVVMLWHNDTVSELQTREGAAAWHRSLYAALTDELAKR
jgi:phage-related protein